MPRSRLASGALAVEHTARRAWRVLPEEIRESPPARVARHAVMTALGAQPPAPPRIVRSLDELDEMIAKLEEAARVSDDSLRDGFRSFRMQLDVEWPQDPFSAGYRHAVMDLYEWLRGEPYRVENEVTPFDVQLALREPFPYLTHSPSTVGNYLIAVGHLVRTLGLGPGSKVLELGPGWGNVAIPLAQMGCEVSVIEVSPLFVELIGTRAAHQGVEITTIAGDFSLVDTLDDRYDAVVFFESFHHSADHLSLLESLGRIVKPGGQIVFAAEPVERRFWVPWGPRMDGESLWAIRRNGWLELGFRSDYFKEALARTGWSLQKFNCSETPWGQVLVASR